MNISYKINDNKYKITFCKTKEAKDISKDLSPLFSDKKILLVIDKNINKNIIHYLIKDLSASKYKISIMQVQGKKFNKNERFLFNIIDTLIKKKFTKKSVVISCGGGIVGDVSALASSLYLRGLIYYHIPTTMTAIVDSCIGGKTGINYKKIINSVGNYFHAKNVFISKNIINFIPLREFRAGIPEIIKCGFINDYSILQKLQNSKEIVMGRNFKFISNLIYLTLKTKIKFFSKDVFEENERLKLNFGHTFAHALEMAMKFNKKEEIRHGEAVGIGMLCEIYYAEGKSKKFFLLEKILKLYNLPTNLRFFKGFKYSKKFENKMFECIFLDKKRVGKHPRCIKIERIGKSSILIMKNNYKFRQTIKNVVF